MTFCHKHPSAAYAPHCAECEIERLQAVNAELLAALQILASPDMWEFIEGEISGQDGWACNCFVWKGAGESACPAEIAQAAIARAEQPQH